MSLMRADTVQEHVQMQQGCVKMGDLEYTSVSVLPMKYTSTSHNPGLSSQNEVY
jgi:hypothetical protein